MLFSKLLLGLMLCLAIGWFFSWLVFWKKNSNALVDFISRILLGSLIAISLYAIFVTKGITIFIMVIPILFSIRYLIKLHSDISIKFNLTNIIALSVFAFIAIFIAYLNIRGVDFKGMKVPINDQAFYSSVASNISNYHSESFITYLNSYFNFTNTTILYHYYEYWFTVIIHKITGENIHFILNGVIFSFSLFCIFSSFYIILIKWVKKHHLFLCIPAILFLFLRGVNHYLPQMGLNFTDAMDSIFFDGIQKLIFPLPFLLIGLYFIFNKSLQIGLLILLVLPILNIVFLPSIIGGLCLCLMINLLLHFKKITEEIRENKHIIFQIVLFLILIFVFMKYFSMNLGKENIVTSVSGILSNLLGTAKNWLIINGILFLIIIVLLTKNFRKEYLSFFILIIGIAVGGAVGYALLDNNQNAWQMFACACRFSNYGLFLFLLFLLKNNLQYIKISVVGLSILSVIMFIENYSDISHLPLKKISAYSPNYINEISKLNFKNKVGVKFVNASNRPELQRNPVYAGIVNYFCLTENAYATVILNVQDLIPIPKDTMVNFEALKSNSIAKEIITFSPFISANKMGNSSYNIKALEDEQEKFIRQYQPEFCILENGIQLPENIKKYVSKSLYDEGTKEQFLLLKY